MKNLVIKYYTLTDPITGEPTKDVGYVYDVSYPQAKVRRINGVPTILEDTVHDVTLTVVPKFTPYVEVNKATYDAVDITGESETMKKLRTAKLLVLERHTLRQLQPAPPEDTQTLGEKYKAFMEAADAATNGEGGGGELP